MRIIVAALISLMQTTACGYWRNAHPLRDGSQLGCLEVERLRQLTVAILPTMLGESRLPLHCSSCARFTGELLFELA
jgi:hypothetical protein